MGSQRRWTNGEDVRLNRAADVSPAKIGGDENETKIDKEREKRN